MRKRSKLFIFCIASLVTGLHASAQTNGEVEDAIFWEISGNGLSEPSYLFGTFHLLDNRYIDSLTHVLEKFHGSKTVIGEMLMDSTIAMRVMMASRLKNTTLDKLLSAEDYQKTASWLKEVMGYDLTFLNGVSPLTIQLLLMASLQKKYYPMNPARDIPMDVYFQKLAREKSKTVVGLETLEKQIEALFGQFSYERQADLLAEYVRDREKAWQQTIEVNILYRQQKLQKLLSLMNDHQFDPKESAVMLDDRNKAWTKQLQEFMKKGSAFIAVGALHLAGKNGLVNQLREEGYVLRPLKLK